MSQDAKPSFFINAQPRTNCPDWIPREEMARRWEEYTRQWLVSYLKGTPGAPLSQVELRAAGHGISTVRLQAVKAQAGIVEFNAPPYGGGPPVLWWRL